MTKDGRPSLLNDIRYFYGTSNIGHDYFKNHEDVVAFGRRIALFLNGRAISLGSYSALYIQFNPSLENGKIDLEKDSPDWWQSYAHIGVPNNFLEMPETSKLAILGTISILNKIAPSLTSEIEAVAKIVKNNSENLRFLIKSHQSKRYIVEVSSNIAEWPSLSYLYVGLTDRESGDYFESRPLPLRLYQDAFHLVGSVKISGSTISILPKKSFNAQFTADSYSEWLAKPVSEFSLISTRPTLSEQLKLGG